MTDKEFAKITPLSSATLNDMAEEFNGCLSLITLYSLRTDKFTTSFRCNYEGHEELLLNQFISLFKTDDRIGQIARQAFLSNLHDETVAGYNLKDE